MKRFIIFLPVFILSTALLLTACSQQTTKETESAAQTKADETAVESTIAETEEDKNNYYDNYYDLLEEETTVPPTVADDLNYYEMYQNAKEEELEYYKKPHDGQGPNFFINQGTQYAKEWKSTDGKISFMLDTELGPYAQYSSPFELTPKYTVNGKEYTNVELELNNTDYEDTCFNMIKWSPGYKCTIILSGPFEYDHEEQSFTVTAGSSILYRPYVPEANYKNTDKMTIDEWNEKYGDPDVPYYHAGEKVTFKMVR